MIFHFYMTYIEAPHEYQGTERSVFLAGGISHTADWQSVLRDLLAHENIALLNPRRKAYDYEDLSAERQQIGWEYAHLRKADAILFWFPEESVAPIALFELGAHTMTNKPIFVGVHPKYERRSDVEIQLSLVRPDIEIVYDLESLSGQIKRWAASSLELNSLGV